MMSDIIIQKNARGVICRYHVQSWTVADSIGNVVSDGFSTYVEAKDYRDAIVPGGVIRPGTHR